MLVFVDCEYTGEHAATTLISVGMTTLRGDDLHVVLNDYDRAQVTPWVREHVLPLIVEGDSVTKAQACRLIEEFLLRVAGGQPVTLVTAGKLTDLTLVFQLWHSKYPELPFFHFGEHLPAVLNHRRHYDLDTLLYAAGWDAKDPPAVPSTARNQRRHHALDDAHAVRSRFVHVVRSGRLPYFLDPAALENC